MFGGIPMGCRHIGSGIEIHFLGLQLGASGTLAAELTLVIRHFSWPVSQVSLPDKFEKSD